MESKGLCIFQSVVTVLKKDHGLYNCEVTLPLIKSCLISKYFKIICCAHEYRANLSNSLKIGHEVFWKSKSQWLQLDIQQSMLFLLIILFFSISYFTRLLFFLRFSNVTHPTSTVYINMREIPDHRWKFWLLPQFVLYRLDQVEGRI